MSDLIVYEKIPSPKIPEDWDFEQADKNFDELIYGWRRFTLDMLKVLWIFYHKLKIGHRPKKGERILTLPTWLEWIESKGISHPTPIAHFRELGWLDGNIHFSSKSNEWCTPESIIDRTISFFGIIDLDPCSGESQNVRAENHFTGGGLDKPWFGSVYMNPPYGREIGSWTNKLVDEYEAQNVTQGIALVPSRTDTDWFKGMASYPRCFIWGRLKFSEYENAAPFPSMAVYLGKNLDGFKESFSDIGDIYVRLG